MPLPTPTLDARSAPELFNELLRRVPVYTPEWTDASASDPGVTLLELFSMMGEYLLNQFNRIPDATRLAFLNLLQVPLLPAQPARALLAFSATTPEVIQAGDEARAGAVPFAIETPLIAYPLRVLAMTRAPVPLPAPGPGASEKERQRRLQDVRNALSKDGAELPELVCYTTRVLAADPGAGGPAIDPADTVDGALWLAVVWDQRTATLRLPGSDAPPILSFGFHPDEAGEIAPTAARPPALHWEISRGGPVTWKDLSPKSERPLYDSLRVVHDSTWGLRRPGIVQLQLPAGWASPGVTGPFDVPEELVGVGDLPPEIEDANEAERLLFWVRVRRADGGQLGPLRYVGINATTALQSRTASPEFLGRGTGQPRQRCRLVYRPVLPGTAQIDVQEPDGAWTRWQEVEDFLRSGEEDRHFVVDVEAGEVRFGDGQRGHAPPEGSEIRATGYRYGGGVEGNVPAGAISKVMNRQAKVSNPLPSRGGSRGETIDEALERIPAVLRHGNRAVTAEDFRTLALMTPGASLGRAECMPLYHPSYPLTDRAGVVSLMIWPAEDPESATPPVPDRTLLRMVNQWLDDKRLVSTELHVIAPRYRRVAVCVGIKTKEGYASQTVRGYVERALRQYLSALPPLGPAGQGWPLGRRVHGPELEAVVLQVEGVEYVEGLVLAHHCADLERWIPGTVQLRRDEVPHLQAVLVLEGPPPQTRTSAKAAAVEAKIEALRLQHAETIRAQEAHCAEELEQLKRTQEAELCKLREEAALPDEPPFAPTLPKSPAHVVALPKLRREC